VIPSVPGYGFSGPPVETGWDSARIAKAWDTLAKRLGYERYGAHGGDLGSQISRELGILKPKGLVGVHVLQIFAFPSGDPAEMERMDEFEREGMKNLANFEENSGYLKIQQTRPQTLAFGLTDSPAGQLAWNTELFAGFGGQGAEYLDRDRFLTHVSIYWFTATGGSAAREYREDALSGAGYREEPKNETPTGVAVFPFDFISVRAFAERANNIVHWSQFDRGGHFAASDAPDLLVGDLRTFFRRFR
jgi:epoxide hydrolase